MSWHLKLSKLSDVLYGDDSARIRSFESAISIASPRDNSDHLLSLGTRLLQKTNKEATTNPAAIKRLTEVLTNSAPNLLESIPCDYSRFYSTHSIGEVVLGLGDLGEDPKLALKIYEKMHSLSHPKDCKHFEVTAQKEAKAYHAINAQEIQTLYASDNHPAVLEKIGIGTEAFNTLYIEKREKLFTLIIQLERDMQFKAAFQCYQFLNTGKLNENNQALHYMTKALLNNNYEEAIFLLNICNDT